MPLSLLWGDNKTTYDFQFRNYYGIYFGESLDDTYKSVYYDSTNDFTVDLTNSEAYITINSEDFSVPSGTTCTGFYFNSQESQFGQTFYINPYESYVIKPIIEWNEVQDIVCRYYGTIYKVRLSWRTNTLQFNSYIPSSPFFVQRDNAITTIPYPSRYRGVIQLDSITQYEYGCVKTPNGLTIEFTTDTLPITIADSSSIGDGPISLYPGVHADEIETVFPPENAKTTTPAPIS